MSKQDLKALETSNNDLKKRSKKSKDNVGSGLARRTDATLKAFKALYDEDESLTKKVDELKKAIKTHNKALSDAVTDLQGLQSDIQKLIPGEPAPRIYANMHPQLQQVRGLYALTEL